MIHKILRVLENVMRFTKYKSYVMCYHIILRHWEVLLHHSSYTG